MRILTAVIFALVLNAGAIIGPSYAQELFGVGTNFENESNEVSARLLNPSSLYSIDPDTGAVTFIGDLGVDDCTGLDFHPLTNELFAACFDIFLGEFVLVKVNPSTGAGTTVGILDAGIQFGNVTDMSFRSDGVLFANLISKPSDVIVIIDTETAEITTVGESGLFFSMGGLGFSLIDSLFYAGFDENLLPDPQALFSIDQGNGSAGFIATLQFSSPRKLIVQSLDTNPDDGVLFIAYTQDGPGADLGTLNTENGEVSDIGPTGGVFIRAIAFPNPLVRNIPTLSQYGLALSAVVLLAAALLVLRRRSFKSNA